MNLILPGDLIPAHIFHFDGVFSPYACEQDSAALIFSFLKLPYREKSFIKVKYAKLWLIFSGVMM